MQLEKQLKKMLTEDCLEVLAYLEGNEILGKNKVFETIETQKGVDSLESLILQLSRVFGAFAFDNTDHVEIFKMRITHLYKAFPEFKIIAPIYMQEVQLKDINVGLSDDAAQTQQEKLNHFFSSITV